MTDTQVRVVVTGLGATTPVGGDVASTWEALLAGRSGVRTLTQDWVEQLPVHIGAPVAVEPTEVLPRVEARRLDRSGQLAMVAAREAWADAGLAGEDSGPDPERLGVVVGTGIGGVHTLLDNYLVLLEKGPRRVSPLAIPMLMPNSAAAHIGLEVGARAGVHTPVSACASGNEAIAWALDLLQSGKADVVVAGGTEAAIHALPMAAFANMMALSNRNDEPERASRPFDKGRNGFVLGEGAAILVLETAEHAEARGARVYAELSGAGLSADAHHIAQPDPVGAGATRAMQEALADAALEPSDIRHVNAHATSTPQGDVAESQAIRRVLGDAADDVVVTSTKSMTGHLLGAAGAVESVATVLALHHRVSPPTLNLENLDDEVQLDVAREEPRALGDGSLAALNNSFGFGGHNCALVFRTAG
jgi:3-oxoacyl-[acyl-carrier-protein] synthase II